MCQITEKITDKSIIRKGVTGYKAVIKTVDNKYLSVSTGIEYKIGKVKQPTKEDAIKFIKNSNWSSPFIHLQFYNDTMRKLGLTNIILDKDYIQDYLINNTDNLTLLKMTIRRNLHYGTYGTTNTVAGSYIVSLEETKIIKHSKKRRY